MHWSPIRRTEVEWPSIVALGPDGWILSATFVVAGALGVVFSVGLVRLFTERLARIAAVCIGVMAAAVACMAFQPDAPGGRSSPSWHDTIHNAIYPLIPASTLAGASFLAIGLRSSRRWRPVARMSALVVVAAAAAITMTAVDSVAQLARYPLFGTLLVWFARLAILTWARSSSDSRCSTS